MSRNITLDSNVLQPIVRPEKFPNDRDATVLRPIHDALGDGRLHGFVPETMADLEAVKRGDRAAYFSGNLSQITINEEELPDGTIKVSFAMGPRPGVHPGVHPILSDRFADALALGVRFLRCSRVSLPRPTLVQDEWFVPEAAELAKSRNEIFGSVCRAIQARGVGRAIVEELGNHLAATARIQANWFQGLALANDQGTVNQVADAVGEWADGDAVAAHIAYGNDLFCTRDRAVGAGTSIMSAENREWLSTTYGVKFVTPLELAQEI